jgi:AraC-like DNA-binding protein
LQLVRDVIVGRLAVGSVTAVLADSRDSPLVEPFGRTPRQYLPRVHAHESAVCWVVAGQCVVEVQRRWVQLDATHALLLRSGEEHRIRPLPDLSTFVAVSWNLCPGGVRIVRDTFGPRSRRRADERIEVPVPVSPLLERIARELQVRRPHYDLFVRGALLETAGLILRARAECGAHDSETGLPAGDWRLSRRRSGWIVDRLVQHLEVTHGDPVTLGQLARTVGLSPSYLTSLFRRHTGRSLMAYLADVRHREALALLRNTDLHVVRIAHLVGYNDPHYFGRVFTAREGCGPAQYRRLVRLAVPGT